MVTLYYGNTNSRSRGARLAEAAGRYPATRMAAYLRRLGLFRGATAADITGAVESTEWHHVGNFAARVPYYGLDDIYRFRRELRAAITARRAAAKPAEMRYDGCMAEWLEWSGTRTHPHATQRRAERIAITRRGKFVILHLGAGGGAPVRKKIGARGLVITLPDGRVL